MIDQPDTAARILTAVEAALGDQLTTTAHVQALDHIRRILGDEPAPDAVAPSPKAPQSQDGENDRLRAKLAAYQSIQRQTCDTIDEQAAEIARLRADLSRLPATMHEAERLRAELAALRAVSRGYCPHCGRGDCAPRLEDWEAERQRAEHAEAAIERVREELSDCDDDKWMVRAGDIRNALDQDEADQPGTDAAEAVAHLAHQREDLRHQIRDLQTTLARVRAIPRLPHFSQQTGELGRAYTRGWESVIDAIDTALDQPKESRT